MKLAILAIGIPGSGKTTALSALARAYSLRRVSRDDIRQQWFGNPHVQERKDAVRREADRRMHEAIAAGNPAVLDSIFIDRGERMRTIAKARAAGATRVVGVVFTTSLAKAKARNRQRTHAVPDEVIDRMYRKFEKSPPARAEGFDALYTSDQLEKLERIELKKR